MNQFPDPSEVSSRAMTCRRRVHGAQHQNSESPPPGRRGSLLVEMVVMTMVISVVAAVLLPMLTSIRTASLNSRYARLAVIELSNLRTRMEQLPQVTEAELAEQIKSVTLEEWFQKRYPESELSIAIVSDEATRISDHLIPLRLTLAGSDSEGNRRRADVSIVAWMNVAATGETP